MSFYICVLCVLHPPGCQPLIFSKCVALRATTECLLCLSDCELCFCLVSAARLGLLSEQHRLLLQQHQLQQLLSSQPSAVRHTHTGTTITHS